MNIVILAGGSGTRFWPLSRKRMPKQLISIIGGKSMLQRTVERVLPLNPGRILVVTNALQAEETAKQLEYLNLTSLEVVAEPSAKNTAPAIALAARLLEDDSDQVMAVLPADHFISDEDGFRAALTQAAAAAENDVLVTLGIVPVRPETGYGYIQMKRDDAKGARPVERFVEKPDLTRALEFLADGSYFWNSGMFVWKSGTILRQMAAHYPAIPAAAEGLDLASPAGLAAFYAATPSESIDYAVMEKSRDVVVLPVSFGWSDVGSWNALPDVLPADAEGNIFIEAEAPVAVDAAGCVAYGDGGAVALIGVSDLVVVKTEDALLVCAKERSQDVKKIVETLQMQGRDRYL